MCGIIGQINLNGTIDKALFDRMRDTLIHRGPDDADSKYFNSGTIALGHRRLSFLDLSKNGLQPMCNEDETVCIVLNGEIYNYVELRDELVSRGHIFKTHSDTETILHGYEQWGMGVLDKLTGMFAFGLMDLKQRKLFLVRDRFGIKPLYYWQSGNELIFASELKAIIANPDVPRQMDVSSFADYFVYRYIPSPKTIWKNISKLPPAHYLEYDYGNGRSSYKEYWRLTPGHEPVNSSELVREIGEMLEKSVTIHARSDVPVGSFLSGGYDSSAIVYYLSKVGYKPETFSIGFKGWDNSEHKYAELVARQFGFPITYELADESSLELLKIMPDVYDEPLADISIIPTWMVSHAAVRKVKAVMSGEGADEIFGGYQWQKAFFANYEKRGLFDKIFNHFKGNDTAGTVAFYAEAMAMGRFDRNELLQLLGPEMHQYVQDDTDWFYRKHANSSFSGLKKIQYLDVKCFMGELVLNKIDRASMANSLEVRVPFLDHKIFEKVLGVREDAYFKSGVTKYLLYENIKEHLPKEILQRRKQGFVGPDSYYINTKIYADILEASRLIKDGLVQRVYRDKLIATNDHWRLWKLAVMENWYGRWVG